MAFQFCKCFQISTDSSTGKSLDLIGSQKQKQTTILTDRATPPPNIKFKKMCPPTPKKVKIGKQAGTGLGQA